jgi:arylsulfatase A-like enzyme
MDSPQGITRVILVVLDGLRADAITSLPLPSLASTAAGGSHTLAGVTVEPSLTAAALTSLFTGVPPQLHGIRHEQRLIPRSGQRLTPLPGLLRDHGYRMQGFMAALPPGFGTVGAVLAARLGAKARFAGHDAESILAEARPTLERDARGVTFLHWPDADLAGHACGWMSAEYCRAADRLDRAFDRLLDLTSALDDPATVIVACADHGGGGDNSHHHDSRHPLDTTIPVIVAGGQVIRNELPSGTSLLDVAATIPWILGIRPPAHWSGRPLHHAFAPVRRPQRTGLTAVAAA